MNRSQEILEKLDMVKFVKDLPDGSSYSIVFNNDKIGSITRYFGFDRGHSSVKYYAVKFRYNGKRYEENLITVQKAKDYVRREVNNE